MAGKHSHIRTRGMCFALVVALVIAPSAEARYAPQPSDAAGTPDTWALVEELQELKADHDKKDAELKMLRERIEALEAARTQKGGVKPDSKDTDTAR